MRERPLKGNWIKICHLWIINFKIILMLKSIKRFNSNANLLRIPNGDIYTTFSKCALFSISVDIFLKISLDLCRSFSVCMINSQKNFLFSLNFFLSFVKIISNCQQHSFALHWYQITSYLCQNKQVALIHLDFICSSSRQIIKKTHTICDLFYFYFFFSTLNATL